ncbi:unnamed protein product [Effrenium voratum]|uniref:Uncharacterized protein n=1 Tax=Effrenium voratum TaxID=2562239 RepID=A0AA36J634_9DINO|nr:unnamed protein product [Effrenium voratum]CAJ1451144.1 unnamed protein product [Effrenium voratum]
MPSQLQRNLQELQGLQRELSWSGRPTPPVKALSSHGEEWLRRSGWRKRLPKAPPARALGQLLGLQKTEAKAGAAEQAQLSAMQALAQASALVEV